MVKPVSLQARGHSDLIDFARGHPSEDLLPLGLLREAARSRLAGNDISPLQYGPEQGDAGFRELLAGVLEEETGTHVDPSRLFVTSGASQALDLICTLYTKSGDTVLVGEPTYHLALELFANHGLLVKGVDSDGEGPRLEALEDALGRWKPALLYLVPSFGNPTGTTLAPERREKLLELVRRHQLLVVADEVYRLLNFKGSPPAGLASEDNEQVVALNSFSKILAPGLRLGWIEGPSGVLDRIEQSGLLQSGGGLNPFVAALVSELLGSGALTEHLGALREAYAVRAAALAGALRQEMPTVRFNTPAGGYFIWAQVPGTDSAALQPQAHDLGVSYAPGERFSSRSGLKDHYRLAFAHYSPAELEEGVARLARVVQSEQHHEQSAVQQVYGKVKEER